MTAIDAARQRYLRLGAHEREHAAYCQVTGRTEWRCWNFLGRRVEAAAIELDMLNAERLVGRQPVIRQARDDRPAWTRYLRHTATCWAYAQGLWCHDCDAADFDADVEARERLSRQPRIASKGIPA